MVARPTLKTINDGLLRRGHTARPAKGSGYFYCYFGEAAGWLERTVQVPTVNRLTMNSGWARSNS